MSNEYLHNTASVWSTLKLATTFSAAVAMSVVGAGCSYAPINEKTRHVNTDHFDSGEALYQKLDEIRPGMHYDEVLATLTLEEQDLQPMGTTGIMRALYGDQAQLQGNLQELNEARAYFDKLSGYRMTYVNMESERYYSGVKQHTESEGSEFDLSLIFDDNQELIKMEVQGEDLDKGRSNTILPRFDNLEVDDLGLY